RRMRDKTRCGATILGLSISPDSRQLALAEQATVMEILDLQRLRDPPRTIPGFAHRVSSVAFSPDGRRLVMSDGQGTTRLLDERSGQILDRFDGRVNNSPYALAFGADGRLLAMTVGDEVQVVR